MAGNHRLQGGMVDFANHNSSLSLFDSMLLMIASGSIYTPRMEPVCSAIKFFNHSGTGEQEDFRFRFVIYIVLIEIKISYVS